MSGRREASHWITWCAGAVLCGVFALLLLLRTLDRGLNHDEHQFLAPAVLLSREGLLPYRDYPLFHLPNLIFAYAASERVTGDPILGPKLISFSATVIAAVAILVVLLRRRAGYVLSTLSIAAALLALLLFDPISLYTAGKTWNHEVPASLLVLGVLFHVECCRRDSLLLIVASGAACGLAVGSRLTFAPSLIALVGLILLFPLAMRRRFVLAGAFTIAATIALTPSLYFLATVPDAFVFGNLEFPRLRLLDPENERIRKTMSLWRKLRYLGKDVIRPGWPLFVAFAASMAAARASSTKRGLTPTTVVLVAAAALLAGCLLPSRYQYQHFFGLIPLLLLGIAFAVSEME